VSGRVSGSNLRGASENFSGGHLDREPLRVRAIERPDVWGGFMKLLGLVFTLAAVQAHGLTINRSSCENNIVSVEVKTGKVTKNTENSLQTSATWVVHGQEYSLNYFLNKITGGESTPYFLQSNMTRTPSGAGVVAISDAKIIMMNDTNGKIEDFSFHRENYAEKDDSGTQRMWDWDDGAVGQLVTTATQETLPDGSVRQVSWTENKTVTKGWRDGGSVHTCTTVAMSRETWLIMASDPNLAGELDKIDALAGKVSEAEEIYKSCTPVNCEALNDNILAKEQAFLTEWNALFASRKDQVSKQYASLRAKLAARAKASSGRATAGRGGSAGCPWWHYDPETGQRWCVRTGVQAALIAVEDARRESKKREVEDELKRLREDLDKLRGHP
jgi:hypothetical protein